MCFKMEVFGSAKKQIWISYIDKNDSVSSLSKKFLLTRFNDRFEEELLGLRRYVATPGAAQGMGFLINYNFLSPGHSLH